MRIDPITEASIARLVRRSNHCSTKRFGMHPLCSNTQEHLAHFEIHPGFGVAGSTSLTWRNPNNRDWLKGDLINQTTYIHFFSWIMDDSNRQLHMSKCPGFPFKSLDPGKQITGNPNHR